MTKHIEQRLARLEAALEPVGVPVALVVLPGESLAAAAERAGYPDGGYLIVGPIMTPDEWHEAAPRQQRELIARQGEMT